MAFRYRHPRIEEYDSMEDYEEAVKAYEWAESDYEDECIDRYYEEKYNS